MAMPIRVGAVNYLNTKPLIHDFDSLAPQAELILDVPSRLADRLAEGELDVALIPVIEYFRAGSFTIVPGISIASHGPVLSVTLFSRVPWAAVRRVALDEGSRTSAALTQVLLRQRYRVRPEVVALPLDRGAEDADADAVLLIGDRAMRACLPGFAHAFDLGQEWYEWTGLPFVYAVWAVRPGADLGGVAQALAEARRRGLTRAGLIAQREAPRLGLDAGFCRRYLATILHNINYTNVCAAVCDFCAFYRKGTDPDAYVLPREVIYQKIEETIALGGDQTLMQGGLHPRLKLEWYEDLLRDLKARYPRFNLHAFSAPEIWWFHKLNKLPLREVLSRLKTAGMGSLPGGGGEILVDRVRQAITVNKCLTDEWLDVHRTWHQLGGKSTCTMMFGHVETLPERIETLERLRQLQDGTGGFTAFICWTFQPQNTALAEIPPT